MKLTKYSAKRDLKKSPEPKGRVKKRKIGEVVFVVQEHHARRLHIAWWRWRKPFMIF
jgi:hypothetical protein